MIVAIDRTDMTFIATGEYRSVWAYARKELPPEAIVIGEIERKATFSCLTDTELKMLYRNTTGNQLEGVCYSSFLEACQDLARGLPPLPLTDDLRPTVPLSAGRSGGTPAPPTPSPKKSQQGGVGAVRPKAGTTTGRVWDICDAEVKAVGGVDKKVLRAAILARGVAEGINPATVQTQFSKWWGAHCKVTST